MTDALMKMLFGDSWDESKHPRAKDGKFGEGSGGGPGSIDDPEHPLSKAMDKANKLSSEAKSIDTWDAHNKALAEHRTVASKLGDHARTLMGPYDRHGYRAPTTASDKVLGYVITIIA